MNALRRWIACLLLLTCFWAGGLADGLAGGPPLAQKLPGGPEGKPTVLYAYPVSIPSELRARNYNGHCVWCCLQTVGRHQNVTPLVNILSEVDQDLEVALDGKTYFDTVHNLLLDRKVAHYFQPRDSFTTTAIQKALARGVGVIVSLNNDSVSYSHAVVLAGYWRDWVSYYDSDAPERVWDVSRTEFDRRWNGQALFLDYLVPVRKLPSPLRRSTGGKGRLLIADLHK